ncbi:MAG: hypothetical protein AB7G08_33540 [Hyphomicrobiaceae bacterium]
MRLVIGILIGLAIMIALVRCDRAPEANDLGYGSVIIDARGR